MLFRSLRGTAITSLPDGLTVGGYLDLRGTAITSLPEKVIGFQIIQKGKWDIIIYKEIIKIGCKEMTTQEWEKFFKAENYFSTNPKNFKEQYNLISQDFEFAKLEQKRMFNKNL